MPAWDITQPIAGWFTALHELQNHPGYRVELDEPVHGKTVLAFLIDEVGAHDARADGIDADPVCMEVLCN